MQTTYFETSCFIRHENNIVNLGAYRQKLSAVSGDSFSAEAEATTTPSRPSPAVLTLMEELTRSRRTVRRRNSALFALCVDVGVSMAVLLFAMTALIQFLRVF